MIFARLFSKRVRELEKSCADLRAMVDGRWGDMSLTQMRFENGRFDVSGLHEGFAGIIAAWGYNSLTACGAENYVEIHVNHPKMGALAILVQRVRGETPATKASRLEKELAKLRSAALSPQEGSR